jgi:hypothetical protein
MSLHKTNGLLKYVLPGVVVVMILGGLYSCSDNNASHPAAPKATNTTTKTTASGDSAAESLDTLTADLRSDKAQVAQIKKQDEILTQQNKALLEKWQNAKDTTTASLATEVEDLKKQMANLHNSTGDDYKIATASGTQTITTVSDLTPPPATDKKTPFNWLNESNTTLAPGISGTATTGSNQKPKPIPYYTIPANSTAVHDRLMSSLVGRIPVKGVVTDPYPFKIVFCNDTLAANGLRVPHLRQMIVSGYSEGDLNLVSVRGWVTSLTFVFEDGTITTTSSNNNDIGNFTKENALGYLSDPHGNPFISGQLITNAPTYLGGNVLLGAAQGAASAYAQEQTTSQTSVLGASTSTVTGSPSKFVLGQAGVNAAGEAQKWWADREQSSFDAVYVPSGKEIVVNFAKEILIDYDPQGRKLAYENTTSTAVRHRLD